MPAPLRIAIAPRASTRLRSGVVVIVYAASHVTRSVTYASVSA